MVTRLPSSLPTTESKKGFLTSKELHALGGSYMKKHFEAHGADLALLGKDPKFKLSRAVGVRINELKELVAAEQDEQKEKDLSYELQVLERYQVALQGNDVFYRAEQHFRNQVQLVSPVLGNDDNSLSAKLGY